MKIISEDKKKVNESRINLDRTYTLEISYDSDATVDEAEDDLFNEIENLTIEGIEDIRLYHRAAESVKKKVK